MDEQLIICDGCLWDEAEAALVRTQISRRAKKKIDKEEFLVDIHGVHQAIGGFHRLAALANENPKWFYNRFGDRLLPNMKEEVDVNITIHPPLPPSPLDDVIDVRPALDQPRDRAPRSIAQGAPCPPGSEDSFIEDEESGAFE
jgi:hypothetical protein